MPNLEVVKGPNQGAKLPLVAEKVIMGRNADCGIVINLPAVSREHAVIMRRGDGKYYIEDLKSRNFTYVNSQKITIPTPLEHNDHIKICDSEFRFLDRLPLPENMSKAGGPVQDDDDDSSSTVEATISQSSKHILETQPSEKLAFLLSITAELTQTFNLDELLPKIANNLFQVFKQADRCFIIFGEDGSDRLVPRVIKTRRGTDDANARFSRRIVHKCLETCEALLSEDASSDKRFDLAQSIADCRIRSVMVAPLAMQSTGKAFAVIQLDTQDRHKKFTQDDLKLLLAVAGQAAIALENSKLHENLMARAGLERDLRLAQKVQDSFLPKKFPQLPGYQFFAHYESAQEVGGDYYDFIPLPGPRVAVMLGDVAGKGVPAALLMAKVSSDARFTMLTERDPAQAIYKLNEQMQEAGMLDRFVTLAAGVLDPAGHRVTFVNAGHMPPLIYRRATGKIEEAVTRDQTGFPLGVAEGIPYDAVTVALNSGDLVTLFTDGVTEAPNKQGQQFEQTGRVPATILAGTVTAEEVGKRLVAAVKQHALGCKQADDITVVCFGRTQ
jgi:serine phosphatase RsbU (regulator of sigma subunit)/pSer/pThr/pTyr-binding forkhead associated (FHA) protein